MVIELPEHPKIHKAFIQNMNKKEGGIKYRGLSVTDVAIFSYVKTEDRNTPFLIDKPNGATGIFPALPVIVRFG